MYTVYCNLFTESERIEHPVREKYCISWVQYLPALAACRFKHSCSFSSTVKRTHKKTQRLSIIVIIDEHKSFTPFHTNISKKLWTPLPRLSK